MGRDRVLGRTGGKAAADRLTAKTRSVEVQGARTPQPALQDWSGGSRTFRSPGTLTSPQILIHWHPAQFLGQGAAGSNGTSSLPPPKELPVHESAMTQAEHSGHKLGCCLRAQSCSVAKSCLTLTAWMAAHQASLSFTISQSLLKLMSKMPSNRLSSSVVPFSSRLQSFPASGSFPMSWLFASEDRVLELQLQHYSF